MFSKNDFNPDTSLEDLTGKVAFVTGGKCVIIFPYFCITCSSVLLRASSRGIGYQTVKFLARKGATVYLGSRSEEAGKAAVAQVEKEGIGKGKVVSTWCDFGTPEKAKETGEKLLSQIDRLDIYGTCNVSCLLVHWTC